MIETNENREQSIDFFDNNFRCLFKRFHNNFRYDGVRARGKSANIFVCLVKGKYREIKWVKE